MLQEIQDIIKKNLPAEVGENLKRVLQEGESAKHSLEVARRELNDTKSERDAFKKERDGLQKQLDAHELLAKREADVLARENKIEVHDAQIRAQTAEHSLSQLFRLTEIAFRNPKIIRTYEDYESIPVQMNGYINNQTKTKRHTETEETNPEGQS